MAQTRHVLAWKGINAVSPSAGRTQVAFRLDYSGGWGTYRKHVWKTFQNACASVRGAAARVVRDRLHRARRQPLGACRAGSGRCPNYGVAPTPSQAVWELRLSHWTGPLPVLTIHLDWAYRRYDHLFGTLTYLGAPVYGFRSTAVGAPLDGFGRNIYVDTFDSVYGSGWRRENSFLSHKGDRRPSATASTRTAAIRSARARSIARPRSARV